MQRVTTRTLRSHTWIRYFLAYLVTAGCVPWLSELRSVTRPGTNPYANFELAWGLMHSVAAIVGICVALWFLRHSPTFAPGVVVILTLQVLFALLEYRREGFNPQIATDLTWGGYLLGLLVLAVPFATAAFFATHRRSFTSLDR